MATVDLFSSLPEAEVQQYAAVNNIDLLVCVAYCALRHSGKSEDYVESEDKDVFLGYYLYVLYRNSIGPFGGLIVGHAIYKTLSNQWSARIATSSAVFQYVYVF